MIMAQGKVKPLIAESLVAERLKALGIEDMSRATIREIVRLANELEAASEVPFVHMEMGVPGLRPSNIGTEAEIAALKAGVAQSYPPVEGIPELKAQVSLFVKNCGGRGGSGGVRTDGRFYAGRDGRLPAGE